MGKSDKDSSKFNSPWEENRVGSPLARKLIQQYEAEIQALRMQLKSLEEENRLLRKRLELSPWEVNSLEAKLRQSNGQLDEAYRRNERLVAALQQAKSQIQALKEEVEKLAAPPLSYGVFADCNADGTVDIYSGGRRMKVNLHPNIKKENLRKGQSVILNEALNVVEICEFELQGEVVQLKELLDGERAVVYGHIDEEWVAQLAEPLRREKLKVGDHLLYDPRSGFLLGRLPKSEVEEVILEEVPVVTYADIGGLDKQIEAIKDVVELPYFYPELFKQYKLHPTKGVLLYGPPGCGKTLLAKALANSLAQQLKEKTGTEIKGYFLYVKGPELLNKYVGETERKIREVFSRAKEKAVEGMPVIIFFDEMDALFRTRGSGISSDVESTIVPQFLSELDGMEGLRNVVVIGASNRQDLIDPAVLRPGRLDIKIKIDRPDREAAKDIFSKYLKSDLPFHEQELKAHRGERVALVRYLIESAVEEMYSLKDQNRFLEVTYANGEREVLYFKDFISGAMIESIVARAKKYAVKRAIYQGESGIKAEDLFSAIREEFKENEDLPNTTNPDDWAKISGRKSERIINVRTIGEKIGGARRRIETITPGQYL